MEDNVTLQEGLEIFQEKNAQYFTQRPMSEQGSAFMRSHDIAHVVFGCDTSVYGEGVVKLWSSFGTTAGFWKVVTGYNEVNAFALFKQYSVKHVFKNIVRLLLVIPKALFRVRRMKKPWPFSDYKCYLNMPISEIRKEFNIHVL